MNSQKQKVLITLPVYNEEKQLYNKTLEIYNFMIKYLSTLDSTILIADNASSDNTAKIGKTLTQKLDKVEYFFSPIKGRGKILYNVWKKYKADCYVYMDIDLSTDLKHLPDLIKAVLINNFDIAIGTRNKQKSQVKRTFKRTVISKVYIALLKFIFRLKVSDTQCGFKALGPNAIKQLWCRMNPKFWKGSAWFFDAEILILAEKLDLAIQEIPVRWKGSSYTTVSLLNDIKENIRGIFRLLKTKPWIK